MHYGAKKETFRFASELRKHLTEAEKKLWSNLCNKLLGYKFRCQHPTWRYVTDFYCHELKLIIEVDGSIHLQDEILQNDADREENLCSFGLTVIRFTNEEVIHDIDIVIDNIECKMNELKSRLDFTVEIFNEELLTKIISRLENSLITSLPQKQSGVE